VIAFLIRRLLFLAILVFSVSSASLILTRLAPGDAFTESWLTSKAATVARNRAEYQLDQPILQQYGHWLIHVARFDFGRSISYGRPVRELLPERARNTALLALVALVAATLVGIPIGVVSGTRPSGALGASLRGISVALVSMPPLVTSLTLVFLAARTGWLPIGGIRSAAADGGSALDLMRHLVVPAAALALPLAAMLERLQAKAVADTMREPFVAAALARGLPRTRVVWRHALKPALRPIAGVYGLIVGTLLSGSFAVEVVTAWPGLGRLMLDALLARDVYLVAGCACAGTVFLALGTIASDVLLAAVDPRPHGAANA
jgi:peptide/nickel transport system permease protein